MFKLKTDPKPANPWADKPFDVMSYDELLAVKIRVDQEFTTRGPSEFEALKEKLTIIASAHGIPLDAIFGTSPKPEKKERKKREVKIKYRNPDNPGETWTGIGRPKRWLQEKLDAGATLQEFAIN